MKTFKLLLAAMLLTGGCAWGSDVYIVLDETTIDASPGQQVTFSGIIFNNDPATVDLNFIDVSLDGMFSVDPSPFFSGPPTVAANSQTVDFSLFNVTVDEPYTDPLGPQQGTLTIFGGEEGAGGYDPTTQNFLGSVTFGVDVMTPEPSTFALFAAATVLMLVRLRGSGFGK
jgi:hypothetical protein